MHLSTHPTSYPTRYQEIAAKLEQELRQHYRCGDYLPAEQQLAARFEVNRHTLRRAIDQLVEKGWVQRRQGVGVLVLMRPFDYPLNAGRVLARICWIRAAIPPAKNCFRYCAPRPATSLTHWGLPRGERHPPAHPASCQRRRALFNRPLLRGPHPLADAATLRQRLAARFSARANRNCAAPQPDADQRPPRPGQECQRLEIPNMSPLLCVRTLNHRDGESSPAEYSVSLTRADMIEFTMEH